MNFKQWIVKKCVEAITQIWPDEIALMVKDALAPGDTLSQDFLNVVLTKAANLPAPE